MGKGVREKGGEDRGGGGERKGGRVDDLVRERASPAYPRCHLQQSLDGVLPYIVTEGMTLQ